MDSVDSRTAGSYVWSSGLEANIILLWISTFGVHFTLSSWGDSCGCYLRGEALFIVKYKFSSLCWPNAYFLVSLSGKWEPGMEIFPSQRKLLDDDILFNETANQLLCLPMQCLWKCKYIEGKYKLCHKYYVLILYCVDTNSSTAVKTRMSL